MENTKSGFKISSWHWDHLHLRGEYQHCLIIYEIAVGSSPLTWRIQSLGLYYYSILRIISTYVENTRVIIQARKWFKDHLHLRGEYFTIKDITGEQLGSSPLTWRILQVAKRSYGVDGIISTYVENTILFSSRLSVVWDHLHLRGEYILNVMKTL